MKTQTISMQFQNQHRTFKTKNENEKWKHDATRGYEKSLIQSSKSWPCREIQLIDSANRFHNNINNNNNFYY